MAYGHQIPHSCEIALEYLGRRSQPPAEEDQVDIHVFHPLQGNCGG